MSRSVRAACIMRGNAPCGVKGINGLRAFGAWHFCAGAKMPNVSIAVYVPPPQGAALGYGQHLGLQPAPIIYRAFVQLVHLHALFLDLFDCARHSPNKFGSALACTNVRIFLRLRAEKPLRPGSSFLNSSKCFCSNLGTKTNIFCK